MYRARMPPLRKVWDTVAIGPMSIGVGLGVDTAVAEKLFEKDSKAPVCIFVLTTSKGWNMIQDAIPARDPAMIEFKTTDRC